MAMVLASARKAAAYHSAEEAAEEGVGELNHDEAGGHGNEIYDRLGEGAVHEWDTVAEDMVGEADMVLEDVLNKVQGLVLEDTRGPWGSLRWVASPRAEAHIW